MKEQKRITSSGRLIEIYDDIFPMSLRQHHMEFVQNSTFRLGSASSGIFWQSENTFFQSVYTQDNFENFRLCSEFLASRLRTYEVNRCWVLSSSPLSTYYFHADNAAENEKAITLLYYVNTRWDRNWGGETLFSNDEGECEIAVEFKPGRVVIFDSLIEHKPSPISMQADEFRFTFVTQFKNKV
jgi:Rps23 Pro-64 3,4-dihydroxylase Tpa1-like proline 4-hydroxylase